MSIAKVPLLSLIVGALIYNGSCTVTVCEDKSKNCNFWKKEGFCDSSSQWINYMKIHCIKTCGFCGSACTGYPVRKAKGCEDKFPFCSWGGSSYCQNESKWYTYMATNCRRTCGLCGAGNGNSSECRGTCADPGNIDFGQRTENGFQHGKEVHYRCAISYVIIGSSRIQCENGRWSSPTPVCKAPCNNPGRPSNGFRFGTNFRHGKTVQFRCWPGYKIEGTRKLKCFDGQWAWGKRRPRCVVADYTSCGVSRTNFRARIVGGNEVKQGTWPWQVGIYNEDNRYPRCGGSLIDKRWVLTAAHCFIKDRKRIKFPAISVKVGDHHVLKKDIQEQEPITAQDIFLHQNYDQRTLFNDIALIKLQKEAELGKYVRTVCLPKDTKEDLATAEKHGFVAGWGVKQKIKAVRHPNQKFAHSKVLRHTALTVQATGVCMNSTDYIVNSTMMFCAGHGRGRNDTCLHDSGGPFVRERYNSDVEKHRWTQVGIVSWGEGCAQEGKYGFFTRTAPYVDWIKKTMNDNKNDEEK